MTELASTTGTFFQNRCLTPPQHTPAPAVPAAAATMPIFTYVARVTDGMPLVASMQQHGDEHMTKYKQQARKIFKRLSSLASLPTEMSIESNEFVFHYIIADGVCFLMLVRAAYPARVAFAFLREIQAGFERDLRLTHGDNWRQAVDTASRPYAFLKFEKFISHKLKEYSNPDSAVSMSALNSEVSEVHSILRKNIQDVLTRGDHLNHMSNLSQELVDKSKKFSWGAKRRNILESFKKWLPCLVLLLIVLIVVYMKFF